MKTLLLLIACTFIEISYGSEVANYTIDKGRLHTGGVAQVSRNESIESMSIIKLSYQIYKKILVPIPDDVLKGESSYELPLEFKDERGYLELETKGEITLPEVKLKFIRRLTWNGLSNAYQFLILPKNGKSSIEAIYHPSIKAAGWGVITVTFISSTPILNGYKIVINLNK